MPEGQPAGLTERGGHQDAVVGDVLDPPAGGAERENIADPRFVDHLLVEFADSRSFLAHHVHREHAAVGDGAARGHRQALGAGPSGETAGVAVPHQTRA